MSFSSFSFFLPLSRLSRLARAGLAALVLGTALALILGLPSLAPASTPASSSETVCQGACQTGREKLAAEKNKNQKRRENGRIFQEAGQKAVRSCLDSIYGQTRSILNFPELPDLSGVLGQICRGSQFSMGQFSLPDLSLPQNSLTDWPR
ncbi:MAG: hypothetical protein LBK52_01315 [Deltaproteobacteria bacterium]|jgi:hypothetical protein|nr:hypothetical protein [Deltaproteobacteria bacterium]